MIFVRSVRGDEFGTFDMKTLFEKIEFRYFVIKSRRVVVIQHDRKEGEDHTERPYDSKEDTERPLDSQEHTERHLDSEEHTERPLWGGA